jgi:hypothetical protein
MAGGRIDMTTLFVKCTGGPDGQEIRWQRDFEYTLESEDWQEFYSLAEYTIPTDDIPAWLAQELDTNPDVISYWLAGQED